LPFFFFFSFYYNCFFFFSKKKKILRDHTAIYVTFAKPGVAQRAAMFLGSGQKQLGYQLVSVSAHQPPANAISTKKTHWEESEMIAEAQNLIIQELRSMLEKDISEKLVAQELKKFIAEERSKATSMLQREQKPLEKKGLKGLSFKKQVKEEVKVVEEEKEEEEDVEEEEEEEEEERPKKKRKTELVKRSRKVVDADDLESEEEDEDDLIKLAALDLDGVRKRAISEGREDDEPVKKKQKIMKVEVKGKKSLTKIKQDDVALVNTELYQAPAVTRLYTSGFDSSLSPSRSPSPIPVHKRRKRLVTPPLPPPPRSPPPPPEIAGLGLCDDDEDLYFAKLALSNEMPIPEKPQSLPSSPDVPTFRKHASGSARTEGYYKITHAEKVAYVVQYQARAANTGSAPAPVDEPQPQHVTSSRSNRANARRRAQGLEEINQVQRAVALSKGENAANELTFKFNQLQTRKKHLRFARSPIHDWGLYAMEKIARGEMVIEYVGEVIRAQVADKREKAYERQGIGSSYLFRIDEDLVVDATKKGNLG
jgi:[histone H3]-lysine4 N-trimethyltransferase SETD1